MSRISVRGFAVASATAVTTVGAVVGVASGSDKSSSTEPVEAVAADTTLLAEIPAGQQAQAQTASLTQQADVQSTAADAEAKKSAEEAARKQAAQDASDKKAAADQAKKEKAEKEAAEKKAAEERAKEKEEAASRSSSRDSLTSTSASSSSFAQRGSYSVADVQAIARQIVPGDQFQCFSNIVNHESTWNYKAVNASSGAYGLVQALPASKMSSAGADWQTNPATQIKWGLNYMNEKYQSPCGAWSFWQTNHWY